MAKTNDVIADVLATADEHAAKYEVLRNQMLAERKATRDAAAMATSLSKMLQQPEPELSPAVVKVLAKRQSRTGDDDGE